MAGPIVGAGIGILDATTAGIATRAESQVIQGWNLVIKGNVAAEGMTAK